MVGVAQVLGLEVVEKEASALGAGQAAERGRKGPRAPRARRHCLPGCMGDVKGKAKGAH